MYRYARSAFFFAFYYRELFPYLVPFVYPLALIAQTGSVYTTLAVTIERYIVICWPLRYDVRISAYSNNWDMSNLSLLLNFNGSYSTIKFPIVL